MYYLDLVGGSTVTLLTFVFPPFFYMKLVDMSSSNPKWKLRYIYISQSSIFIYQENAYKKVENNVINNKSKFPKKKK